MKKKVLFAAMAIIALASCSSDEMVSVSSPPEPTMTNPEPSQAIVFSSASKGITRADLTGAKAAEKLGNKFVVSAKKGSTTAATDGAVTFDNYLVEYTENTAHTTESNTTNWEYVGKGRIKHAIDHGITSQTIKYWDYSQPQYDFIAWSTGSKTAVYNESELTAGKVYVSSIDPNATATKAYTFAGTAEDLKECYIADLVTVKKAQYGDDPVTFSFRQLGTKVRIGIYETIPGYSVKDVKFYTKDGILDADPANATIPAAGQIVEDATIFSTAADIYTEGTYTITFPSVDGTTSDNNQAHVTFAPKSGVAQTTTVNWGGLNYTIAEEGERIGTEFLGRSSNTASFAGDPEQNYYVVYLPNETGANLNLRVNFTLEAIDGGGEEIFVKNAKAQVPSIYTKWKPGFAYTYLFKISDKTNGRTGVYDPLYADDATVNSDPAGLYPITFDAVVVNAEDNDATQETITTVMTPSITSYQQASTVVNADEYTANGNDIFVTVSENDNLVTMTNTNSVTDNDAALYTIPAGKTEAEVVDAMQMQDDDAASGTVKGRSGLVLTEADFTLTNSVEFGADGNAISVASNQSLRFTPTANTTYAFVYTKTAPTATNDMFQPVTKAAGVNVNGFYRFAYKAATHSYYDNNGTTDVTTDDTEYFDAQKGVKYFSKNASDVYTMETAFIGQGVGNLYTRSGAGTDANPYVYTIASGYAKSEVAYYYTTDHGMTYNEAHNVAYEYFVAHSESSATIFKNNTGTIAKPDSESEPVDGQDYYFYDGSKYIYCVILPQQTKTWYELNETANKVACGAAETAIAGQTYFDKYTKNDGEYYAKIIKVQ